MTWMKRWVLALVVAGWGSGCGGREAAAPDSGETPNTPTPTPTAVKGSITVHTGLEASEVAENEASVQVFLGNGSRFLKALDPTGDVTFQDSSLEGPQDITLVAHSADGFTSVYTYLGINAREVWLPDLSEDSPETSEPRAYVTGKVSGLSRYSNTFVRAVGPSAWGSAPVTPDGSYRIEVEGSLPGTVNLVAIENGTEFREIKSVGMRRNISVPDWEQVSGQDLVLDHPVDQQVKVTINNAQAYDHDFGSASLSFYQDDQFLFETSKDAFDSPSGGLPTSLPAIALTPPFDTVRAVLAVDSGFPFDPAGTVYARGPVENLSSATLSLPRPAALSNPSLGTVFEPGTASLAGLSFRWSADAEAQMVKLTLSPMPDPFSTDPYSGNLAWTIMAPGSVSTFTPFRLPSPAGGALLSRGRYGVFLTSRFDGGVGRYEDLFARTPAKAASVRRQWSTSVNGDLELQ